MNEVLQRVIPVTATESAPSTWGSLLNYPSLPCLRSYVKSRWPLTPQSTPSLLLNEFKAVFADTLRGSIYNTDRAHRCFEKVEVARC